MSFNSRIAKTLFLSVGVFLSAFIFQLVFIWYLYPSPSDFVPIETITGKYTYEKGNSRSNGHSFVAKHQIFCTVNSIDSDSPCRYSYLEGKNVTVRIARYRQLFGVGEVVVKAMTEDGRVPIEYSGEQLVLQWCSLSLLRPILQAAVLVVIFNAIRKYRFLKKEQKNGI